MPKAQDAIGIAFVGCGFVADFYALNLRLHPELRLIGLFDHDPQRIRYLQEVHGGKGYGSLRELLDDDQVKIVVNLTSPASHYSVSKQALLAGKHVYSEKPLALTLEEAADLVETAERLGLHLSGAPCTALGPSLRCLRETIQSGRIGSPRLVYADMDDGPMHRMQPGEWRSPSGVAWPWHDELTLGCTIEHAAYHIHWMVLTFGPIDSISATAKNVFAGDTYKLSNTAAPDLSIATIRFANGVIARLTCSIIAPHDTGLRVIGDEGELLIKESWNVEAPLQIRRYSEIGLHAASYSWIAQRPLLGRLLGSSSRTIRPLGAGKLRSRFRRHQIDYAAGVSDLASAIVEQRQPTLSARLLLHVTEAVLAIARAGEQGSFVPMTTSPAHGDRRHAPLRA